MTTTADLIEGLSANMTPQEWRDQATQIIKGLPAELVQKSTTTANFTQPAVGVPIVVAVDRTLWMAKNQPLMVVDNSTGVVGAYEVAAVLSETQVQLKLVAWGGNVTAGSIILADAWVLPGAPNSQVWANISADNGFDFRLRADSVLVPNVASTTLTVAFKLADLTLASRTLKLNLSSVDGSVTVDPGETFSVDGIVYAETPGPRTKTVEFTHAASGAKASASVGVSLDGADGADGEQGIQGPAAPSTVWCGTYQPNLSYPADANGLLAIVHYQGWLFVAIAQAGLVVKNVTPPSAATDNSAWKYAGLVDDFVFEGEWNGPARIPDDTRSRVALQALQAHFVPKPGASHQSGDYDTAQLVSLFVPPNGITRYTLDGSDVAADDAIYNPNMLLWSENLAGANWIKSAEITVDAEGGDAFDEVGLDYTPLVDRLELTAGTPNFYQNVDAVDLPNMVGQGVTYTASIIVRSDVPCQIRGEISEFNGGASLDSLSVETTPVGDAFRMCRVSHTTQDAAVNRLRVTWRIVDAGEAASSNACTILAASGQYVDVTRSTLVRGNHPPLYIYNRAEVARQEGTYASNGPLISMDGAAITLKARTHYFDDKPHSPQNKIVLDTGQVAKVAKPTSNQPSGSYPALYDLNITLECSTAGAAIYYTLDGSTPSGSSTLFTGPIAITGVSQSITLKAIAIKGGMTDSDILTRTYYFEDLYAYGYPYGSSYNLP